MCVAIPGKVISLDNKSALVDFEGNRVSARTGLVDVKPGDYVLVHAGCVIQKMSGDEAGEIIGLMNEERVALDEHR